MLFTNYLLNRMARLEKATRGYGPCISERALFATLLEQGIAADDSLILLKWGILTGLLTQDDTLNGRRFMVERKALAALRSRANGESAPNSAPLTGLAPDRRPIATGPANPPRKR